MSILISQIAQQIRVSESGIRQSLVFVPINARPTYSEVLPIYYINSLLMVYCVLQCIYINNRRNMTMWPFGNIDDKKNKTRKVKDHLKGKDWKIKTEYKQQGQSRYAIYSLKE